jgi:integral membrane sensor domain MASE1
MRPRPARQLTIFFFVYILAAWLGSKLSLAPHLGVTLWPVSGLYMGALVRLGARDLRPWIAVATLADMTASILLFGFPIGVAVFVSAGNSLEAWGGAAMLRRWYGGRFHLRTTRDGMAFVVMAGCIAPLGSMVLGGTFVGLHTGTPVLDSWRLWWSGDAVGVILVAPAVICLGPRTWRTLRNASAADFGEIAALMAMTVVLGYVCLAQSHPFAFLMLPLVIPRIPVDRRPDPRLYRARDGAVRRESLDG